jgi:hypothetical protein
MYNCAQTVNNIRVAVRQRSVKGILGDVDLGNFAYNEVPTIAVAIDCWFRARHKLTRPFLCSKRLISIT